MAIKQVNKGNTVGSHVLVYENHMQVKTRIT